MLRGGHDRWPAADRTGLDPTSRRSRDLQGLAKEGGDLGRVDPVLDKTMDGSAAMIPIGLSLAMAIGLAVGAINYGLIRLLSIPPIIATLSSSFIFQSAAIW